MTRPQIIRAEINIPPSITDTIDLQADQTSPSAQDHSRKPHPSASGGPAPQSHQAAELRHVQEERHSEEESLSHAWSQANGLSDEPPNDDDNDNNDNDPRDFADGMHGNEVTSRQQHQDQNYQNQDGDDHDMADAESGDDMDDDMMDKISSSPSISDGGLTPFHNTFTTTISHSTTTVWPRRLSSLEFSASSSPLRGLSPSPYSGGGEISDSEDGSSPFVQTPAHLPLYAPSSKERSPSPGSPYMGRSVRTRPSTPLAVEVVVDEEASSSSPFTTPPAHFPLRAPFARGAPSPPPRIQVKSEVHHRFVGFVTPPDQENQDDEGFHEVDIDETIHFSGDEDLQEEMRDTLSPLYSPSFRERLNVSLRAKQALYMQLPELVKSTSDMELDRQLLPIHDPLLESDATLPMKKVSSQPRSDHDSSTGGTLGAFHRAHLISGPRLQPSPSMYLQPPGMVKSASDMSLDRQLLPMDDPLLDDDDNDSVDSDHDSEWETDSCQSSKDSFSSAEYLLDITNSQNNIGDDEPYDPCFADFSTDDRFVDSGWGGECLREPEDIDFEFVYALHTFVATVEGQANAQKGDTMVLLDDSNSYWWLVRVVKDSTIGYLPAEHIETPTERLARLNKHRNVDLSQTMLGDTTEKTKNPLKKAMRRRNAKTVTFSAPTYVEPSDYEFSSDEEMEPEGSLTGDSNAQSVNGNDAEERDQDEITTANTPAPLSIKQVHREDSPEKGNDLDDDEEQMRRAGEESRASDEIFDQQFKGQGPNKSRNGTVRNTDSFFRDESIETRKITLTPNILRDDSTNPANRSLEKERERPSFDLLAPDDPKTKITTKKDKKEKKPGMLSGLFKRKGGKKGVADIDGPRPGSGKSSGESARESPSMELGRDSPVEKTSSLETPLQRSSSRGKLVKSPPSPILPSGPSGALSPTGIRPVGATDLRVQKQPSPELSGNGSSDSTPRATSPEKTSEKLALRVEPPLQQQNGGILHDLSNKIRSPSREGTHPVKREKIKRAKQREALDVESSPDDDRQADPFADQFEVDNRRQMQPIQENSGAMNGSPERLSESPIHITSEDATPDHEPPALVGDSSSTSSVDELASLRSSPSPPVTSATITDFNEPSHFHEPTPVLSPSGSSTPSPSSPVLPTAPLSFSRPHPPPTGLAPPPPTRSPPPQPHSGISPSFPPYPHLSQSTSKESFDTANNNTHNNNNNAAGLRNSSTSTDASNTNLSSPPMSPPWSDAHLRAYLDDSSDIKELLLLVNDTHGVVPVGADHEIMRDLYKEEKGKIAEMNGVLDGLLGGWLARRKEGVGRR
ncbi:hypothetical protein EJ08DRAFT_710374 [Tothia fuscella]|uniref:SH3 domain-containing protein n=1 Tax=Tothia fuscella TaxID=1048955 RepID=A0A9P4U0Z7_9PEZI|nr:hypothetical protein EJ08DRAFT_710374 [Tothia fuscella]